MVLLSSLVWFSAFGIPFREEESGSVLVLLSSRESGFLLPWQERGSLRHPAHLSIHCCLRLACAGVILSWFLSWSCCMQIQIWLSVISAAPIPEHPEAGRAEGCSVPMVSVCSKRYAERAFPGLLKRFLCQD